MKKLKVQDLKEGMMLAENVYAKHGTLLMGKGMVIKDTHLKQLTKLGVSVLWIETPEENNEICSEQAASIEKEVHATLDAQFEAVSQNPIMQELKEVFKKYLIKKKSACVKKT